MDKLKEKLTINWKLRYKNKATLAAIVSMIFLLIQQLGFSVPDNIKAAIDTILGILVLAGVLVDPTTQGVADSQKALGYDEPKPKQTKL